MVNIWKSGDPRSNQGPATIATSTFLSRKFWTLSVPDGHEHQ